MTSSHFRKEPRFGTALYYIISQPPNAAQKLKRQAMAGSQKMMGLASPKPKAKST